jgi:PAS domain S-box-containing protein
MSPVRFRNNSDSGTGLTYQQFIERLPASLIGIDPTGLLINVNETALRMLEYSSRRDVGARLTDLCVDHQQGIAMLRVLLEVGALADYYVDVRCGDGTTKRVSVSSQGFGEADESGRAWCVLQDVTSRSLARSMLVKLDARYQALLEATEEGIYGVDMEGRCLFMNDVAAFLLGMRSDDCIGAPVHNLVQYRQQDPLGNPASPSDASGYRPFYPGVTCSAEGQVWCRHNGKVSLVEYSSYPIVEEGELTGTVVSFCDLTARRKTIQTLRNSVSLFRGLAERSQQIFWIFDVRRNQVDYVSPGYEAIWGRPCADLYGSPSSWIEAIHPDDRDRFEQHDPLGRAGTPYDIEYRIIRPDGDIRWIHGRAFPLQDASGTVSRVAGIAEDVSKYKRVTEVLETTLAQVRALSSRTEVTREEERMRIGQEVHDDLGGVLTYLKLDLSRLCNTMSEEGPSLSPQIHKRLASMVEALDAAITTVQRIAVELRPVVLEQLGLSSALVWQARQFERRTGIRCHCAPHYSLNSFEKQQALSIFRIVQEALTNVARHANATTVEITVQEHDNDLLLSIRDNGKGISRAAVAAATSLGLRGMQERAILAGATLMIEGHSESGTTVTIRCPALSRQPHIP